MGYVGIWDVGGRVEGINGAEEGKEGYEGSNEFQRGNGKGGGLRMFDFEKLESS